MAFRADSLRFVQISFPAFITRSTLSLHTCFYLNSPVETVDEELMFRLIKAAFSQRRKTLVNCLFNSPDFNFDKAQLGEILTSDRKSVV